MKREKVEMEIRKWLRELADLLVVFMGDREVALECYVESKRLEARELLRRWRAAGRE